MPHGDAHHSTHAHEHSAHAHEHSAHAPEHGLTGHDADHATTLRTLLEEPLLRHATLLADDAALDTRIEWCLPWSVAARTSDPLTAVLVHADQGFVDDDPDYVRRHVAAMAARGTAALAVNAGPAVSGVLRKACADAQLPLLCLGEDTRHRVLSRLVAEKALAYEAHVLQYGVTVHQALGEVLYRGAGLAAMARQIGRLSRCTVLLLDPQLELLVCEPPAWSTEPDDALALIREEINAGRPHQPADGGRTHASTAVLDLPSGATTAVIAPIVLGGTTYGWVVLLEREHPPRRHDLAQHLVIAEQGATITGSEMLRLRSVDAAEERARGDFVHALLHSRFANAHELAIRATHHGFNTEAPYGVVVVHGPFDMSTAVGLERQASLVRGVRRIMPSPACQTLATTVGGLLVVVRQVGPGKGTARDTRAEQEALAAFAQELDRDLATRLGAATRVTYGRTGIGAPGVATSYREARLAMGVAQRLGLSRLCGYTELRVYAALSELTASRQALSFAREVLLPLRRHDEGGDTLEDVVLAYIDAGGNLNAAARRLHLHRNTMSYKLERAARLLRMDLHDPDALFTIWLAHRIDLLVHVGADLSAEVGPLPGVSPAAAESP